MGEYNLGENIPLGFKLSTANAGFRYSNRDDLGLVVAENPCTYAAAFTKNIFCAAPVALAKKFLAEKTKARAIVINAGQANACTGEDGTQDCLKTLEFIASNFNLDIHEVLPASTGVIGDRINLDKFASAMPQLKENLGTKTALDFNKAIMTTDAFEKIASKEIEVEGKTVKVLGIAKGAGMICPNMATMLSVILCDAEISQELWQEIISSSVNYTFNRVSVDGDTSTNDTIFALASGQAKVNITPHNYKELQLAVTEILANLAYLLVADGEGAKKVLHINVQNTKTEEDAILIAKTVGHSQLVKTAMYGNDANWGRIVAAAGRSGVVFNERELELSISDLIIFKNAMPIKLENEDKLNELIKQKDVFINIKLNSGSASAQILCSDLGHEYVDCNAAYRS